MRTLKLTLFFFLLSVVSLSAKEESHVPYFPDNGDLILEEPIDYYVTGDTPFQEAYIADIRHEDAWIILEKIRPSVFLEDFISKIKINGADLKNGENCRVAIYGDGCAIIPHTPDYIPLKVYTEEAYNGIEKEFKAGGLAISLKDEEYKDIDNAISSFTLKKGYMVTFANEKSGQGFSRVFIADTDDIEVELLQTELNDKISFIRVFKWQWPAKRGWCSSGSNWLNETELTGSTWMYSWSADKETGTDYEYVPIRQKMGWPGFNQINSKLNVTHLLGHNEPDKDDQANMTVEQAISDWPSMMASGLRVGSPSMASNEAWLRNFIAECDKRNYRVDFVAIHAYWSYHNGGEVVVISDPEGNEKEYVSVNPETWAAALKRWYENGGKRPLWITEWNNGANWTNGSNNDNFPTDTAGQNQKQLIDLPKILYVMDTCQYVERYSIYNWVEDKRAIVRTKETGEQYLTPAGEYYRNSAGDSLAFNKKYEHIPVAKMASPELKLTFTHSNKTVDLKWTDYNGEITTEYIVQADRNYSGGFSDLEKGKMGDENGLDKTYSYQINPESSSRYFYRIKVTNEAEESALSNQQVLEVGAINGSGPIRYGTLGITDTENKSVYYTQPYDATPAVFFTSYSNVNSNAYLAYQLSDRSTEGFIFTPTYWNYVKDSDKKTLEPETSSFIASSYGNSTWGELATETGEIKSVKNEWVEVKFNQPFEQTPVVLVTTSASKLTYPVVPRVKDVTKDGFKVRLTREQGVSIRFSPEDVNYFAVEPGSTTVNGKKVKVGSSENVGQLAGRVTVEFGEEFANPVFFAAIQTSNDDYTYMMRYRNLTTTQVEMFKVMERSKGLSTGESDNVGWIVVEGDPDPTTGIDDVPVIENEGEELVVYPSVTSGDLNVNVSDGVVLEIYNMTGVLVAKIPCYNGNVNVSGILDGIYIIRTSDGRTQRFVKVS